MPTDISQGEIVNSAALPSLDGKNKSDKDDASENFGAEVEPHQKPAAKTNKHAIKTNEKKKSARKKTLRETSVRKDESGAASPEPVDAVMEIESDKSEDDGSGSRQQEEIGQVEVINESVSADVSSSDKKVIPSKPAVSKISNKRTHTQTETRRSRSVKKVASTKKESQKITKRETKNRAKLQTIEPNQHTKGEKSTSKRIKTDKGSAKPKVKQTADKQSQQQETKPLDETKCKDKKTEVLKVSVSVQQKHTRNKECKLSQLEKPAHKESMNKNEKLIAETKILEQSSSNAKTRKTTKGEKHILNKEDKVKASKAPREVKKTESIAANKDAENKANIEKKENITKTVEDILSKKPHSRMKSSDKKSSAINENIAVVKETKKSTRETSKSTKKDKQNIRLTSESKKSVKSRINEIAAPKESEEKRSKHGKPEAKSKSKEKIVNKTK